MKKLFFLIILLFSIHFYGLTFIPQKYNSENILSWLIFGVCYLLVIDKKEVYFKNAIIFFFFGVIINVFSAYINQEQSIKATLLAFSPFYFIFFYFFLHKMDISIKFLEEIIILFAVFYSLIYIIQVLVNPYPIVNTPLYADRGTIRLRIEGNGFLVMAYLLLLNRFLIKRELKNLLIALIFFIILLMGGFRTFTLGTMVLSLIMFFRLGTFNFRDYFMLVFVVLLFFVLFKVEGISKILKGMVESTEDVINSGERYIRFLQLDFFIHEFPKNLSVYFLGSGLPGGYSSYYQLVQSYGYNFGFYWADIGLIGLYIIIGPIALGGILWYTIKAIFIKLPTDKLYLNLYFAYLFIVSFTTMEIFREGIFAVQAIGLYLIDMAVKEQKNKISTINEVTVY